MTGGRLSGMVPRLSVVHDPGVEFTPNVDELLANNTAYVAAFDDDHLPVIPARHVAVVACMDSRMDIFGILGLRHGEAHVTRNAGGVVTDDVVRSVCVSQRLLHTREVILLHHTDCGLQKIDAVAFKQELEAEVGIKPAWSLESFTDPGADVRQSIARLLASPLLRHKEHISGFAYDVDTGALTAA